EIEDVVVARPARLAVHAPVIAEILVERETDRTVLRDDAVADRRSERAARHEVAHTVDLIGLDLLHLATVGAANALARRTVERDRQIELRLVVDVLREQRDRSRVVREFLLQVAAQLEALGIVAGLDRAVVRAIE